MGKEKIKSRIMPTPPCARVDSNPWFFCCVQQCPFAVFSRRLGRADLDKDVGRGQKLWGWCPAKGFVLL